MHRSSLRWSSIWSKSTSIVANPSGSPVVLHRAGSAALSAVWVRARSAELSQLHPELLFVANRPRPLHSSSQLTRLDHLDTSKIRSPQVLSSTNHRRTRHQPLAKSTSALRMRTRPCKRLGPTDDGTFLLIGRRLSAESSSPMKCCPSQLVPQRNLPLRISIPCAP